MRIRFAPWRSSKSIEPPLPFPPPTVWQITTSRHKIPYLPSDHPNRLIPPTQCGKSPPQGIKFPISLHRIFASSLILPHIPTLLQGFQFSLVLCYPPECFYPSCDVEEHLPYILLFIKRFFIGFLCLTTLLNDFIIAQ